MSNLDVLVAHQRHRGGCLCGWAEMGRSHPEHVATMLADQRAQDGIVVVRRDDVHRLAYPEGYVSMQRAASRRALRAAFAALAALAAPTPKETDR